MTVHEISWTIMTPNRLQVTHDFQMSRFTMHQSGSRFGNLIETMISLWSAVSGGNDWMNYGELLRLVHLQWRGWFHNIS